jgi:ABC-type nitrate/sulfonate/bicarbonate transport system substrate-binding protein
MNRTLMRLATGLVATVLMLGGANAQTKQVDVRIGWNPFAGGTPITAILIEQKLFEEEAAKFDYDVNVEWLQFVAGAPPANAALVAGRLDMDIDYAGAAIVTRIKQDIPVVLFGVHASHLSNAVVVRPGDGIDEFAKLEGKTVGLPVATSAHYTLASILKHQTGKSIEDLGIDLVNMVPSDGITMPSGLDAAGVWVPFRFMGDTLGTASLLGDSSGFSGPAHKTPNQRFEGLEDAWGYPEGYLVDRLYLSARRAFAEEHPELLTAFLRARIRAQDLANEDLEKALEAANEWWKLDPEVAAQARDTYPENTNIRNAPFLLEYDALAIIKASEFFASIGIIDTPVTWDEVREIITPTAAMQKAAWEEGGSEPGIEAMEGHFHGSNPTWPNLTIAGGRPVWMLDETENWGERHYKPGPFLTD